MLDLSTYRIRIGYFNGGNTQRNHYKYTKMQNRRYQRKSQERETDVTFDEILKKLKNTWTLCFVTLLIILLLSWTPTDNRSGKNRQRGKQFKNFDYLSEQEKTLFNQIRALDEKLLRSNSHLDYFQSCKKLNVHPNNLNKLEHFNVAFANENLNNIKSIGNRHIKETLDICIIHFELEIKKQEEEMKIKKDLLRNHCTYDRFNTLNSKLKKHKKKISYRLAKTKEKKLSKLLLQIDQPSEKRYTHNDIWIPELNLTKTDKECVENGEELDDFHIMTAMNLLKKDYPYIVCQPPRLLQSTGLDYYPFETVQIINNNANHWIFLTSLKEKIIIYDSLKVQ